MPLYEYQCLTCGEKSEVLQRMSDPPLATCPKCGGEVKKLISSPAFQFKGTGWYVTDYAGKGGDKGSGKSDSGDAAKSEGGASTEGASSATGSASSEAPSKSEAAPKPAAAPSKSDS